MKDKQNKKKEEKKLVDPTEDLLKYDKELTKKVLDNPLTDKDLSKKKKPKEKQE